MPRAPQDDPQAVYVSVVALIDEHLADGNLGTAWLARRVGLSMRQLQRVLARVGETTVRDLIYEARMRRAYELMIRGGLPARAVAPLVGYRGAPYLAKQFRRRYGAQPHVVRTRYELVRGRH